MTTMRSVRWRAWRLAWLRRQQEAAGCRLLVTCDCGASNTWLATHCSGCGTAVRSAEEVRLVLNHGKTIHTPQCRYSTGELWEWARFQKWDNIRQIVADMGYHYCKICKPTVGR